MKKILFSQVKNVSLVSQTIVVINVVLDMKKKNMWIVFLFPAGDPGTSTILSSVLTVTTILPPGPTLVVYSTNPGFNPLSRQQRENVADLTAMSRTLMVLIRTHMDLK